MNGVHYRLKTVGLRADYLLNFNTAFGGYNRNRLFEVVGVAGIEGIYAKKSMDKAAIVPGARNWFTRKSSPDKRYRLLR